MILLPYDAERLNAESAEELGWNPTWLGLGENCWGDTLTQTVAAFQASSLGPGGDPSVIRGVVGWPTFLRLAFMREVDVLDEPEVATGSVLYRGREVVFPLPVARMLIVKHYWRCPRKRSNGKRCSGKRYAKPGKCRRCGTARKRGRRFRRRRSNGDPRFAVWHWPVTESARSTHNMLTIRGLSSHGEVTWDGRLVQFVDLENVCYHAGSSANNAGLGFDVGLRPRRKNTDEGNAYLRDELGRPPRPVLEGLRVNSWRPGPILYYYDRQLEAVAAVRAGLHVHCGIPLESPWDRGPLRYGKPHGTAEVRRLRGHCNHSDVWRGKWDAAISDATPIPSLGVTVLERAREYVEQGWL